MRPVDGRCGRGRSAAGAGVAAILAVGLFVSGCGDDDASTASGGGEEVASSVGCAECHAASDRSTVGPGFGGLFGSTVTLDDGSTLVADREYLRRSIEDPGADIVEGYGNTMPSTSLDERQLNQLLDYLESLGER